MVVEGGKGRGVSAYLPCLPLFLCPPGVGEDADCMCVCVCVFRGYDMLLSMSEVTSPLGGFLTAIPCVLLEVLQVRRSVRMCIV